MTEKITIKSIAKELGVSFSTVSKALNDDPNVKNETKQLVVDKAKELNYNYNYFAKNLRNNKSRTIGIILNDLDIPSYANIVNKIAIDLAQYNYTTLTCDSQYNLDLERKNIRTVLSRMPEAIIFSSVSTESENISLLNRVLDKTIILDNLMENAETSYININHERAGYLSAKYLIKKGHLKNLILAGPEDFPGSVLFLNGIRQAYEEKSIPLDDQYIFHTIPSMDVSTKIVSEALKRSDSGNLYKFTGVLSFCDTMAFGVYAAAKKLNLDIPNDISVIGYDDSPFNDYTAPPLTSIHAPNERLAAICSKLLISRLIKNKTNLSSISFEPYLVERGSVSNIREVH